MSRYYEMQISVVDAEWSEDKTAAVKDAIEEEGWPVTDSWLDVGRSDTAYAATFVGQSNLCGGESPDEFTQRIAHVIWGVLGHYCKISVAAVYLDDPPCEHFLADEEDYERYVEQSKKETNAS